MTTAAPVLNQRYYPVTLDNSKRDLSTAPIHDGGDDKILQHILKKLDEGSETIINLHSLLNMKTVELNELIHQLKLIDQVLASVEKGTEQMEEILKDIVGNTDDGRTTSSLSVNSENSSSSIATLCSQQDHKLIDAEAALDSAIKSASRLYNIDQTSRYEPVAEREILLNKIHNLLVQLNITPSSIEDYKKDDIKLLQKAYVDLDLAKNIATSIRNNYKYRSTLLKKRNPPIERIKQMGEDIRKQVTLYRTYTKNASLRIHGKEDILSILNREDQLLPTTKKKHTYTSATSITKQRPISLLPSATTTAKTYSSSNKKRQLSSPVNNDNGTKKANSSRRNTMTPAVAAKNDCRIIASAKSTKTPVHTPQQPQEQLFARPTSASMAKMKEKKQSNGPGSALRLRNLLAKKRNSMHVTDAKNNSCQQQQQRQLLRRMSSATTVC